MREKILKYIKTWELRGYSNGIPEEADHNLELLCKAPSYRHICRAILRNDIALTSLGFSKTKTPSYMAIKKLEIDERIRRNSRKA
jgi:predicted phosphoadenosine phosphosulfate sulfurtransferase